VETPAPFSLPSSDGTVRSAQDAMKISVALLVLMTAIPALAQDEADYLDDRSTPEAVISSYYNAINRAEYARAYSYFGHDDAPEYDSWEMGYYDTQHVEVSFGQSAQEGAAGSTYWTLPVKLDVTASSREHSYFAGCYTLRLAQPAIQAPPFQPLHIVEGKLKKTDVQGFAPTNCDP
jgi:hypothetical protein